MTTDIRYAGDTEYSISCTGDAVVGDEVRFERAMFSGSFRNPKFIGYELVTATIIADSYGNDKQQHTFTLKYPDGGKTTIKGRNLYRQGLWRKPWAEETARISALSEKHYRGDIARAARKTRREEGNHACF